MILVFFLNLSLFVKYHFQVPEEILEVDQMKHVLNDAKKTSDFFWDYTYHCLFPGIFT